MERHPTQATVPATGTSPAIVEASGADAQVAGTGFYPMAPGNRWRYFSSGVKQIIYYEGEVALKSWESKTEVVQVRVEEMHGRMYMREEIGIPDTVLAGGGVRWRRQDETGLYEYGPSPPGAPPYTETRLLAYPLHVGARWEVFDSSPLGVIARVEGLEVLRSPAGRFAAWRIRISNGATEKLVWYGRAGFLGSKEHFEGGKGEGPGSYRVIQDDARLLTELQISREPW